MIAIELLFVLALLVALAAVYRRLIRSQRFTRMVSVPPEEDDEIILNLEESRRAAEAHLANTAKQIVKKRRNAERIRKQIGTVAPKEKREDENPDV